MFSRYIDKKAVTNESLYLSHNFGKMVVYCVGMILYFITVLRKEQEHQMTTFLLLLDVQN